MRLRFNMTQSQLAEQCKVSKATIINWEKGERIPDAVKLRYLATSLKTSTSYLTAETNDPSPLRTGSEFVAPVTHAQFFQDSQKLLEGPLDFGSEIGATIPENQDELPNIAPDLGQEMRDTDTETPRNERGEIVEIEPGSIVYEYYKGFSDEKIKLTFPPGTSPEEMEEKISRSVRATLRGTVPEQDLEPQKEKTGDNTSSIAVVI